MMNSPVRGRSCDSLPPRSLPIQAEQRACTVRSCGMPIHVLTILLAAALLATNALAAAPAIRDDVTERPKIGIGAATVSVPEKQGVSAAFEVSLTVPDPAQDTSVDYTTVDNTARAQLDYVATSGRLTIPAGAIAAMIFVPIIDDSVPEDPESFRMVLSNQSGNADLSRHFAQTVSIVDDDAPAQGGIRLVRDDLEVYAPDDCRDRQGNALASCDVREGRLEVEIDGVWGTVCDDHWTDINAAVACKELGYPGSVRNGERFLAAYFGAGDESMPIWFDNLSCYGDENRLIDCPLFQTRIGEHNCGHDEDVGIRCLSDDSGASPQGGALRLAKDDVTAYGPDDCRDGQGNVVETCSTREGRLEIAHDGVWGTVCDDYWTDDDAAVACRQLGFPGSEPNGGRFLKAHFGSAGDSVPIWLDDMLCHGHEERLMDCPRNNVEIGEHNCDHEEDVGVRCLPEETLGATAPLAPGM